MLKLIISLICNYNYGVLYATNVLQQMLPGKDMTFYFNFIMDKLEGPIDKEFHKSIICTMDEYSYSVAITVSV